MFGGVSGSGSSGRRGSGTGRPSGNTRRGDAGTGSSGASGSTSGGRLFCFFFFCFCFFFLFCFFRFGLTSIDVHLSVRDLPIRRQTNTGVVRGSGASYHHRLLWDAVKEGNTALVESLVAQEPEAVHIVDSVRSRPSDRVVVAVVGGGRRKGGKRERPVGCCCCISRVDFPRRRLPVGWIGSGPRNIPHFQPQTAVWLESHSQCGARRPPGCACALGGRVRVRRQLQGEERVRFPLQCVCGCSRCTPSPPPFSPCLPHAFLLHFASLSGALADLRFTALHWAAEQGHLAVVKYLVDIGANVNATNKYGCVPLVRFFFFFLS